MNKILIALIFSILLIPNVFALNWMNTCLNSTTLYKEVIINYNNTEYKFNQIVNCEYGCYYGHCQDSPLLMDGVFFLITLGFSLFLFTRKDRIICLFGCLITLLIGIWILTQGIFLFGTFINNTLSLLFSLILIGMAIYRIYVVAIG